MALKPTATGSPANTLTAVMSGQIDIGWSSPPLGVEDLEQGKDPAGRPWQRRCVAA